MNTQKDLNKYVKEKDETAAAALLIPIIETIKSVDNYSLLVQTVTKNIKNDNNALLFANLMVQHSDKVAINSFDADVVQKFYTMSLKSQLVAVRMAAILNLKNDAQNLVLFETVLAELKMVEKNEKVLQLLNDVEL